MFLESRGGGRLEVTVRAMVLKDFQMDVVYVFPQAGVRPKQLFTMTALDFLPLSVREPHVCQQAALRGALEITELAAYVPYLQMYRGHVILKLRGSARPVIALRALVSVVLHVNESVVGLEAGGPGVALAADVAHVVFGLLVDGSVVLFERVLAVAPERAAGLLTEEGLVLVLLQPVGRQGLLRLGLDAAEVADEGADLPVSHLYVMLQSFLALALHVALVTLELLLVNIFLLIFHHGVFHLRMALQEVAAYGYVATSAAGKIVDIVSRGLS